jgi:outer membrane protein, heavy metal efflux system
VGALFERRWTICDRRLFLSAWIVGCVLTAGTASPQTSPVPEPLTLEGALERAVGVNPTIAAARFRRLASLAGVDVARERLNPEARIEIERETPTQAYGLAVPLELGDKRARRIAVGEAAVLTSEAELAQVIAETRNAVRRAYFDRLIAESRLALLEELQALATRVRVAAQQRVDAGDAPLLEVVQAELALAQAQNEATGSLGAVVAARATLNALLAIPLDAPTPLATSLEAAPPPLVEAALVRARLASAELALLDRRLDEQRARIALAQALQTPDVTPEATITRGQPEFATGWRAAVAVAIPVFTRHRAGVRLEEITLQQIVAERDATLARISGEVTSAVAIADAQRQQFLRYRDQIIPQAVVVERMAEDSYRLGQTGIAAFLQALQASRDVRLRSLQSASDLQTALVDLERAIGAPLP